MSNGSGPFEPAEAFDRSIEAGANLQDPGPAGPRGAFGRLIDAASDIHWRRIGAVLGLCLFAAASIVVYREAEGVTWDHLQEAIAGVSQAHLAGAVLATAASYLVLIGYDVLALRQVGARVSLATAATASFIGQAFTFTIGFGLLTGNAVRLRIYTAAGVSALDIVAIGFLCAITFWLGLAALAGIALISEPSLISLVDDAPVVLNRALGVLILAALAAYVVWAAIRRTRVRVGQWGFTLPGPAGEPCGHRARRARYRRRGPGALAPAAADRRCLVPGLPDDLRRRHGARGRQPRAGRRRRVRDGFPPGPAAVPDRGSRGRPGPVPDRLLPDPVRTGAPAPRLPRAGRAPEADHPRRAAHRRIPALPVPAGQCVGGVRGRRGASPLRRHPERDGAAAARAPFHPPAVRRILPPPRQRRGRAPAGRRDGAGAPACHRLAMGHRAPGGGRGVLPRQGGGLRGSARVRRRPGIPPGRTP